MLTYKRVCNLCSVQLQRFFLKRITSNYQAKWLYICNKHYGTEKDELPVYETPVENIRNFSIIAHVDHGKSTLADRLLELTGAIKKDSGKQVLDTLQVEKERGITVKAQIASLNYTCEGSQYLLNLIDTPGHVDFSAELYRSLSACQGVILLIDANDGVQAQTRANYRLAIDHNLTIIPVINKIDLPNANPDRVIQQLETLFGIDKSKVLKISAKHGTGVSEVLDTVVKRIPPPAVSRDKPFKASIFDSWYHKFKGAVSLISVKEGSLSMGQYIVSVHTKKCYEIKHLFLLRPGEENVKTLFAGQVGGIACNMRSSKEAYIGDTLHLKNVPVEPLTGFRLPKPMVYAGIYPLDQSELPNLKNAIEKLTLNDNAVSLAIESCAALGQGWRLGFLGILHMEVFTQRLEQEFNAEPIVTAPNVTYKAKIADNKYIKKHGTDIISFNNPINMPNASYVKEIYEPMVLGTIVTPVRYVGAVMTLCRNSRGVKTLEKHIDDDTLMIQYLLPLNEVIMDFYDILKQTTSGYASFDYENDDYQAASIVKLDFLLNGMVVPELSMLVHTSKAVSLGKKLCTKLLDVVPRQQFLISIQAAIGSKILARENLQPYRKDVTAKLHGGGDKSRKIKLLRAQKEGKKRLRMIGKVSLPRESFINMLKKE